MARSETWYDPYWKQRKYPYCIYCSKPITQSPGVGRPRKTCSDRCRQADRRAQQRYVRDEMNAVIDGSHDRFVTVRFYGDWRRGQAYRDVMRDKAELEAAAL